MKQNAFDAICEMAVARSKLKKDTVAVICGDPGSGKSGLAQQIGYATDPSFSPSKNILFYPRLETAKKIFDDLGANHTVIFDEKN